LKNRYPGRTFRLRLGAWLICTVGLPAGAAEPPPPDAAAVARGGALFQRYCTECHGRDGRAQVDVISDATDLTQPAHYYNGSSDQDMYTSIANGAGVAMPAFSDKFADDRDIWDLVYYIKTLWQQ